MDKIINDSKMCGYAIGYNNDSGLIYKTQCGLNAYQHKKNIIPQPGINTFNYSNLMNTEAMEETLLDEDKDFFEGPKEELEPVPNPQTRQENNEIPLNERGGKTQKEF